MAYSNGRKSIPSRKRNKAAYDAGQPFVVPSINCDTLTVAGNPVDATPVCFHAESQVQQTMGGAWDILEWPTVLRADGVTITNLTDVKVPVAGCYTVSYSVTLSAAILISMFTINSTDTGNTKFYASQYDSSSGESQANGTQSVFLQAGDVIRVFIFSGGTSPKFTDLAYRNVLTIAKVA